MGGMKLAGGGELGFPLRPAYGSSGKPITVWANYFKLWTPPQTLYKYAIEVVRVVAKDTKDAKPGKSVDPPAVKGRKLFLVLQLAMKELQNLEQGCVIATEFKSQLVSTRKLNNNVVSVMFNPEGSNRTETYSIKLNGPTEARIDDLLEYLLTMNDSSDPNGQIFPKFADSVDALGVILGFFPRSTEGMAAIGSARFFRVSPAISASLGPQKGGRALEAIRGYFQSVRLGTGRVLVNTNVTHGVFKAALKVVDFFKILGVVIDRWDKLSNRELHALETAHKLLAKTRVEYRFKNDAGQVVIGKKTISGLARAPLNKIAAKMKNPPRFRYGRYGGPNDVKFFMETPPPGLETPDGMVIVRDYFKASKLLDFE